MNALLHTLMSLFCTMLSLYDAASLCTYWDKLPLISLYTNMVGNLDFISSFQLALSYVLVNWYFVRLYWQPTVLINEFGRTINPFGFVRAPT